MVSANGDFFTRLRYELPVLVKHMVCIEPLLVKREALHIKLSSCLVPDGKEVVGG